VGKKPRDLLQDIVDRSTPVSVDIAMMSADDKQTLKNFLRRTQKEAWDIRKMVTELEVMATEKGYQDILDIINKEI
jgi:hypothetical protein